MANYQRLNTKRKFEEEEKSSSSSHSSQQRYDRDTDAYNANKFQKLQKKTPNKHIVAAHYNSKIDVGIERRRESTIIFLRSFNNWIKSVLIGKYVTRDGCALDIGCGKGGDLLKWNKANIKSLVGLDIAEISIEDAKKRCNEMKGKKLEAEFYVLDCFTKPISKEITNNKLFDIASMQFCLHYSFEEEQKARMALENVSSNLKSGGMFIGTVPDAYWIVKKLKSLPEDQLEFKNSIYSIRFEQRDNFPTYGHKYWFYLKDAINDCPEYLVHFPTFEKLANSYGLELEYKKRFHDLFNEVKEEPHYRDLLYDMRVIDKRNNEEMSDDEWQATGMYIGFAFRKK